MPPNPSSLPGAERGDTALQLCGIVWSLTGMLGRFIKRSSAAVSKKLNEFSNPDMSGLHREK